jgi:hypothetical protein
MLDHGRFVGGGAGRGHRLGFNGGKPGCVADGLTTTTGEQ